jgi:hypothetical protein
MIVKETQTIAPAEQALPMIDEGAGGGNAEHRLGVSPATLYRYIPAARTANAPDV